MLIDRAGLFVGVFMGFSAPGAGALPVGPSASPVLLPSPAFMQSTQASQPTPTPTPAPAAEPPKPAVDEAAQKKQKVKLERELTIARKNLDKTKLAHRSAEINNKLQVEKAQFELDLAQKRLDVYLNEEVPARLARADLNMKYANDGLKEQKQEMEQLLKMYSEEQFADSTKDIVVERGQRRLDRTEEGLRIATKEDQTLRQKTIPYETAERKQQVEDKKKALEQIARDWEMSGIDRQIAMINSEAEILRLEDEIATLVKEMEKAATQAAAAATSAPASGGSGK